MPGSLFHVGAVATCPHGIRVQVISTNTRVLLNGMPAATTADQFVIAGCPFTVPPGKPQPCATINPMTLLPATRVTINGQPAVLNTSLAPALCQSPDQIPNGPPIVISTQTRVIGV